VADRLIWVALLVVLVAGSAAFRVPSRRKRRGTGTDGAFRPAVEFLIASSCPAFKEDGATRVSLSGAAGQDREGRGRRGAGPVARHPGRGAYLPDTSVRELLQLVGSG
jgi:hypothetical protein